MYKKWIELGLNKGFKDIEIYATRNKNFSLSVYQQKVDSYEKSDVEVVKVKAIYDGKAVNAKFENLSTTNFESILDRLIENAKALTVTEPALIFEGSKKYPKVDEELFDFDTIDNSEKIDLLMALEKGVLACSEVAQVQSTQYSETFSQTVIVNSKGLNLKKQSSYAMAYAMGVFQRGEDIKTAYDIKIAKKFSDFNVDEMIKNTIQKGVDKLGGSSLKSGQYPVVFSKEMFAQILSVFSSIFTGEAAYRNLTALKDKVGEKIAVESFNLIDDPMHKDAVFKTPFDDEGVATKRNYLIEKGVFKGFIHNLKTASIFNVEPTGNGFSGSIAPANLYLEPGTKSFDELIKDIKEGVFITDLVGLHAGVKTVSGEFSLQAGGRIIKDGKLDHAVKMIVVSGNYFNMLNNVVGIANDIEFSVFGASSPSVHVDGLMIGGEA